MQVWPVCVAFVLVLVSADRLDAQAVASSTWRLAAEAEQQQLEIAAVRAVTGDARFTVGGDLALDPRLFFDARHDDPGYDSRTPPTQRSEVPISHSLPHLERIKSMLGLSAIVDDSASCHSTVPAKCRIGDRKGVVAFSPGMVAGDSAAISIKRITAVTSSRKDGVGVTIWRVSLVRTVDSWRATGITMISVF